MIHSTMCCVESSGEVPCTYVQKFLHSVTFAIFVDQHYKQMWNSLFTLHYMDDDRENVKIVLHNHF